MNKSDWNIEWDIEPYDPALLQRQITENWMKIDAFIQELREAANNRIRKPSDKEAVLWHLR